ncbi:hypothetical protein [Rhizobium ruizarguesonis]|uniref:hypothetical protein n=1 Tax=Rhizobium ruizarguesonis TaxID=2081791 RepID=UPI0013C18A1E|nr:hypothetical protein [Rhizobium ruizarguesonis]NEH28155.1 hypothetical protein [Rhizobium ruizarguesonis]NEK07481.1 hypothetical protein [Rhizobium ruizarguesonis]
MMGNFAVYTVLLANGFFNDGNVSSTMPNVSPFKQMSYQRCIEVEIKTDGKCTAFPGTGRQ